jgi:hypothetical protein
MRILVMGIAIFALAAAPCAWDTDPRKPSATAAFFGGRMASSDWGSVQAIPKRGLNGPFN